MDLTSFNVLDECVKSKFNTFCVDDYIISAFQEEEESTNFYTINEDEFLKMILEL